MTANTQGERIATIEAEVKYIRGDLSEVLDLLKDGSGKIGANSGDLQMVKKDLYGNGKDGMVQEMKSVNTYIDKQKGAMFVTKILSGIIGAVSGLFVTLIPIILGFFIKK